MSPSDPVPPEVQALRDRSQAELAGLTVAQELADIREAAAARHRGGDHLVQLAAAAARALRRQDRSTRHRHGQSPGRAAGRR
ncbi:hypothetical protein R8Z50_22750 [Longispora sp. K20-0274]|uniref:hypothetical protein n=1 Tax=Longispora sp. K20-0274 TaxID=3088255 RepID=UPI00399A81D1